jgi:hypothetical protein
MVFDKQLTIANGRTGRRDPGRSLVDQALVSLQISGHPVRKAYGTKFGQFVMLFPAQDQRLQR